MTYCVGLLVDTGLVLLSDSRTNAGVDQINTFRKMATFQRPDDRVLVLLSAGNLAITQAVVNLLHETPEDSDVPARIYRAKEHVQCGARGRRCAARDPRRAMPSMLKEHGHEFNGTFILGGQIKGEEPRLFHIYSAGNFIESSSRHAVFSDRRVEVRQAHHRPRDLAQQQPRAGRQVRAGLHGLDHPLEFVRRVRRWISPSSAATNSSSRRTSASIIENEYFKMIRTRWGFALQEVFSELPNPKW